MQGAEFRNLAVGRVGWNREVGVVERKLKNVSQIKLGVVAQTGAGIRAEEHTSELQSRPTRRSSDLNLAAWRVGWN